MPKHYTTAIVGSGQAGPALAVALAGRGETVALIEGSLLGGSCVNVGCTPTKTLRKSARVAHVARRAADFGVHIGEVSVDFSAAMARMRARVETSRKGLQSWLEGTDGVDIIRGWGTFEGREGDTFLLRAGDTSLSVDKVYLNTGTRAFVPAIKGVETVPYLDNVSLLALEKRPEHLIVVGGSYIGLETGQIFRRLGSEVTIINNEARVAIREDSDVSGIIEGFFADEDILVINNAEIESIKRTGDGVTLNLGDDSSVIGSHVLFATGRTPNSDRLDAAAVGLETDGKGFIGTDAQFRTNVPSIWALGDINKRGAFTHTSYHDHEIVLANLADDPGVLHQWKNADERVMSYAMFTDPPLGRTGMSLADAQRAANDGRHILTAERAMNDVGRAKEEGETVGIIRLIVDGDSEEILGATVLGIAGDEVIAVITNFMATGASYRMMQQALPIHPTVSELLPTILGGLKRLAPE